MRTMRRNRKLMLAVSLMVLLTFALAGCSGNSSQVDKKNNDSADKGPVKILYVEWSCATATSNVIAEILEQKMGYEVELTSVAASAMYEGLSKGDADAVFCTWLPVTHGDYMAKVGDEVENLGVNCPGARLALVVPDYVTINSIEELNGVKDKFKGEIIGIDPGAGIMKCTEKAIKDYGLDYKLMEGTGATMTASLKNAIDKNEWVVVTGWIPHWKFARWDLKCLEDPKKSLGEEEHIDTVVRKGLKEDMPDVYEFFDNFQWTSDDLSSAMIMANEDGATGRSAAAKWVKENEELVNKWLPEKYKK